MTKKTGKTAATKAPEKTAASTAQTVVDRAADLSDDVLKSVEAGQRSAIEAVRKFVDTVDEALPAKEDRPSRRETVIDAALDMADRLVTTQYEFLRSVVRSADRTLRKPDDSQPFKANAPNNEGHPQQPLPLDPNSTQVAAVAS